MFKRNWYNVGDLITLDNLCWLVVEIKKDKFRMVSFYPRTSLWYNKKDFLHDLRARKIRYYPCQKK